MTYDEQILILQTRVLNALEELTKVEYLKLYTVGNWFLNRNGNVTYSNGNDLFHEALNRSLEPDENSEIPQLRRNWPSDVEFFTFIKNAMRSIANEVSGSNSKSEAIVKWDDECEESPLDKMGDEKYEPSSLLIQNQDKQSALDAIQTLFQEFANTNVEWLLRAKEEGWRKTEVLEKSGMTETEYESAKKRLNRRSLKLFPNRKINSVKEQSANDPHKPATDWRSMQ